MKYPFNNLYDIVVANIQKKPRKTVILDNEKTITNREFKTLVDNVAQYLLDSGVKPGDKVAVIMGNCYEFIVNIFAISKVGAVVVTINNFLKEDELAYIINDSQSKLLFVSAKFAKEATNLVSKTCASKIIWVDTPPLNNEQNIDYNKIITQSNSQISEPHNSKIDDTAFILYTSGTTGKPKGAMLSFKNIFSNCEGGRNLFEINRDGRFSMIAYLPMFHAFTLTATILLPIYTNSTVIVIRSISGIRDFKNLLKQVLTSRCRYFAGVPDVFNAMSRAKLPWYFHWLHNVSGFISGAAPLADETLHRFTNTFHRGKLLQGYGITECAPIISCNSTRNNKDGSVGRPLADYKIKICDDNMQEVATDSIGEICVKGDNVMQGYYNRPDDTKEAIVDGWFRTGDIGRVDKDGFIFIVDRKKDIIIHKGMNIYPREIEEILFTHEKIMACAVVGIRDKDADETPVAYIELKDGETANEAELKAFLKPHLATFKQPRKIFFLDKLPRNATGKILKRELRELNK